MSVNHYKSAMR